MSYTFSNKTSNFEETQLRLSDSSSSSSSSEQPALGWLPWSLIGSFVCAIGGHLLYRAATLYQVNSSIVHIHVCVWMYM
jgi:hypothetical protein